MTRVGSASHAPSKRKSSTALARLEKTQKLTPPSTTVAPSGKLRPDKTVIGAILDVFGGDGAGSGRATHETVQSRRGADARGRPPRSGTAVIRPPTSPTVDRGRRARRTLRRDAAYAALARARRLSS